MLLATEPSSLTVDADTFDLSTSDSVGLEWDCERERGTDKLRLAQPMGLEGKVPLFTRTISNQPPKVVVDCSPEVTAYADTSLSMSSGFCPTEWGLEIQLKERNRDRAVADLRLGQEWIKGYECLRRKL
jgi:hypothetical protein